MRRQVDLHLRKRSKITIKSNSKNNSFMKLNIRSKRKSESNMKRTNTSKSIRVILRV